MKVLITGANGLIGQGLINYLSRDKNNQITATSRRTVITNQDISTFTVDLVYADINKLMDTLKPDTLIHCAAIASPDACEVDRFASQRMNVDVTSRLAAACKDYSVKMVFISTDLIFDGIKGNYTEEDKPMPINFYGVTKADAENAIMSSGINAAIIRTSMVYGYNLRIARKNIIVRIIESLSKGKPFRIAADQIRTPTYIDDLTGAISKIAQGEFTGIFNIAGEETIAVKDFARLLVDSFSLDPSLLIPVKTKDLPDPAVRPLNTSLSIIKAKEMLGYKPTSLGDSFKAIRQQYQEVKNLC